MLEVIIFNSVVGLAAASAEHRVLEEGFPLGLLVELAYRMVGLVEGRDGDDVCCCVI